MQDFIKTEEEILKFWEKNKIYDKVKKKNSKGKGFYFLDGPPYTSGRVHIGTAWNKALKDCFLRFKRMNGFNVWDRAGYDMHGLPIEHKVEAKFNLKNKEEIKKFGVGKFVNECKKFAVDNMLLMNKDFSRLGVWMDFENAYQTLSREYIGGEWWLVKKAYENNRLYESNKTMAWCAGCASALAKHELEYENVKDNSIYVKFKLIDKKDEYLIIWTSTPWTICYNLAVMINPNFDYARIKVDKEIWIVAKELVKNLMKEVGKEYNVVEVVKGSILKGLRYEHPLSKGIDFKNLINKNKQKNMHTVVMSKEYVDLSAGTGLVHCAPGCGPEDYEVGIKNNLDIFNNLDMYGVFPKEMGKLAGFKARSDDDKFIDLLKDNIIASKKIDHDYAHCWRCKNAVVFRATHQWFFKVEDLKKEMIKLNDKVKWTPEAAYNSFNSWLMNLRDNSITKQRYWGTPLPIWRCDKCKNYTVIGSIKELEKKSGKKLKEPHIPLVDELTIKCKCGSEQKRIPDTLDVWVDAGTASWNCLDYPSKKELFNKLFPADFILEGKDQIRGWFNLLMVASMVAMKKISFKAVYMHGFIQDALGRKMSKSLGNQISPEEIIGKYGADVLRYYMIGAANPAVDLNYNFEDMKVKHRNLIVLNNLASYLINYAGSEKINPSKLKIKERDLEEMYILSKLHSSIKKQTELFNGYLLNETPLVAEELFLELSRVYVQLIRDKLSVGSERDKKLVLFTLYNSLLENLKIFSPVAPFITESIYQRLRKEFKLKEESIHLFDWPKFDKKKIDTKLEEQVWVIKRVIQDILAERERAGIGVRWPLQDVTILTKDTKIKTSVNKLKKIILKQVNIKELKVDSSKNISSKFEIVLNTQLTKELEEEGFSREIIRRIQDLRKKANLKKEDKIRLVINSDYDLAKFKGDIVEKVGAKKLEFNKEVSYENADEVIIKKEKFKILFNVLK